MKIKAYFFICMVMCITESSCSLHNKAVLDSFAVDKQLEYCDAQVKRTLAKVDNDSSRMPRCVNANSADWYMVNIYDWTSGFWPGILWYDYEVTQDENIKKTAIRYTEYLLPLALPDHIGDHDIGFQLFCSFGNAYRQTENEAYKDVLIEGARKLATLYNPKVGTILSWPGMVEKMSWPHNTILDNLMNLEILFWASKNGGKKEWYDIAKNHAQVTMENQFRDDFTSYHVAVYDTITGKLIKGVTNQGYGDETFWARGQAWSIYGYTIAYRETGDKNFLRFAEKITDVYLKRLPEDYIPYWDFDDPNIPDAPKDASSAAIVSSALLEMSQLEDNKEKAKAYKDVAIKMLENLSSDKYQSRDANSSFLLHSTGNYPGGYEIDASINYADHYYLEALVRYKEMQSNTK
jgi:unsaturated chondroitin disaccharide hydrolase